MEGEKINRISELEKEIELKKAELRELKRKRHLDFGDYIAFGDGIYGSYSLGNFLYAELRSLVTKVCSMKEETRRCDGTKYITSNKRTKTSEMTDEELRFCNDFLKELYPIVVKYSRIILERRKNDSTGTCGKG